MRERREKSRSAPQAAASGKRRAWRRRREKRGVMGVSRRGARLALARVGHAHGEDAGGVGAGGAAVQGLAVAVDDDDAFPSAEEFGDALLNP